ncbi:MAG: hypothetical protein ACYCS8_07655 [Acidithiobacillus sp.]|uniref:hypothetical protein n=1 Tax=Acidithiobacillus ferrooxidans TaxID=920 RepID=UPI0013D2C393|nr:hypothetical protein [Acidithiobacillus ferrooxidans]
MSREIAIIVNQDGDIQGVAGLEACDKVVIVSYCDNDINNTHIDRSERVCFDDDSTDMCIMDTANLFDTPKFEAARIAAFGYLSDIENGLVA